MPFSSSVATSGKSGWRLGPAMAIIFTLPVRACWMPGPGSNIRSITPASRSFSAGPAPLYGTWFSFTLASRAYTSVAICGEVPLPGVP